MAICRMCHKSIPDGMDFCEECSIKRNNQADESYLDSLLSSVSGNSAVKPVNPLLKKKNDIAENDDNNAAVGSGVSADSLDELLGSIDDIDDSSYTPEEDVSLDSLLAGLEEELNPSGTVSASDDVPEFDLDSLGTDPSIPETDMSDVSGEPIPDVTDGLITDMPEESVPDAMDGLIPDMPIDGTADMSGISDEPISDVSMGGIGDMPGISDEPTADISMDGIGDMPGISDEPIPDVPMAGTGDMPGISDEPISDVSVDEIGDMPGISDESISDISMEGTDDISSAISAEDITDVPGEPIPDAMDGLISDIPAENVPDAMDGMISDIPIDGSADMSGISDEPILDMPIDQSADMSGISDEPISDISMDETADMSGISDELISDVSMDGTDDISSTIPAEDITDVPGEPVSDTMDGLMSDMPEESTPDAMDGLISDIPEESTPDVTDGMMSDMPGVSEPDTGEDMDELLSSLLSSMDDAKKNAPPEEENPIKSDDIEGLFDEAESLIGPSDDTQTSTGSGDTGDIELPSDFEIPDINSIDETSVQEGLPDDLGTIDVTDIPDNGGTSENGDSLDIDSILSESGLDLNLNDASLSQPDPQIETPADTDQQSGEQNIQVLNEIPNDTGISADDLMALNEGLDIDLGNGDQGPVISAPGDTSDITMIDPITGEALDQANIDMMFADVADEGSKTFLSEEDLENSSLGGDPGIGSFLEEIDTGEFEERIKNLSEEEPDKKSGKKKKKKKSLFQRLFANIELTPEQIKERDDKAKAEEEAKKKTEEDKKKKAEQSKEQKEQAKAEAKAKAEEDAKKKAEEKKRKAEEAKEKAKKKKEERLAIEEFEADEGRINRAGATILFVIFALLTIFIIVGTNIYSYNLSIQTAEEEFGEKHYNEAYYQVYGLKVQDKDIELVDKIMTAMYVQNALNSYNNYMYSHNDEKALDALLKGLQRYDKYLELAALLGITEDLNYLKSQILVALDKDFDISEKQAYDMLAIRDDLDYSEYIYSLLGTYDLEIFE
ncbi:MAG: hypothetical protein K6G81_04775 [Lachnospiraceae bacterium]|nr:hypothetical protein [Lachnospiraceae bacterium]